MRDTGMSVVFQAKSGIVGNYGTGLLCHSFYIIIFSATQEDQKIFPAKYPIEKEPTGAMVRGCTLYILISLFRPSFPPSLPPSLSPSLPLSLPPSLSL